MKIVVDIPDKYMKGKKVENGSLACEYILEAVYNGTPLPKGHGRLIDADELESRMKIGYCIVRDAPTIIEADKAGEESEKSF